VVLIAIIVGVLAAAVGLFLLAVFFEDTEDDAESIEAERYAERVREKHDAANDILGHARWCVEMSSMAATQSGQRKPARRQAADSPTVVDAEFTVNHNGPRG
jgi:hypothetical protein